MRGKGLSSPGTPTGVPGTAPSVNSQNRTGEGKLGASSLLQSESELTWIVVPAGFLSQRRLALVPRGPVRAPPLPTPCTLNQRSAGIPHPESLRLLLAERRRGSLALRRQHLHCHTPSPSQAQHTGAHTHSQGGIRPRWGGATGCYVTDGRLR